MNKRKLNADTLEIASFETAAQPVPAPQQRMTGTTGYCNTCMPTACNWTV